MVNILIIADLDHYKQLSKISNNRIQFLNYLNDKYDNITLVGSTNNNNFKKGMDIYSLIDKLQVKVDIIVHTIIGPGAGPLENQILVSNLARIPICKVLWIEDFHYVPLFAKLIKKYNFDSALIQLRNKKVMHHYLQLCPKLIIACFEHFIDDQIFKDYQLEKKYDVLLYGYLDTCYPFRTRMAKLLSNCTDLQIKIIEHPGYKSLEGKKTIIGKDLAKEINQSWLTFCSRSSYDLMLKKYLETAMSGSMVLGNIPTDYQGLLTDKIIKIDENMSDDQIISVIKEALSNKNQLQEKIKALNNLFHSKFNYLAGGEYFIFQMNQIMAVKQYKSRTTTSV